MVKRRARRAGAAVAVLATLFAGWVLAHRLADRAPPPPPWPSPTLPNPAAPADNGLEAIVRPLTFGAEDPPGELRDLVDPLRANDVRDREARARWAATEGARRALREWSDQPDTRRMLERADAALAAPRFVDPCDVRRDHCDVLRALRLLRFVALANLESAAAGDWITAFTRGRDLLRASRDFAASGQGYVGTSVAAVLPLVAAANLRTLVAGVRTARPDAATRAALDAMIASLRGLAGPLGTEALDPRRALRFEHARGRQQIVTHFLAAPADGPMGQLLRWLTAGPATLAAWDANAVAHQRWLDGSPTAPPPPVTPRRARGPRWWLWNPGGKMVLDVMVFDDPKVLRQLVDARPQADRALAALGVDLMVLEGERIVGEVFEVSNAAPR